MGSCKRHRQFPRLSLLVWGTVAAWSAHAQPLAVSEASPALVDAPPVATTAASSPATAKASPVLLQASRDYVVGASMPIGEGSVSLKPLYAFQIGRIRVSSGGAGALLGLGKKPVDTGVSTALVDDEDWNVRLSFRYDRGRAADEGATEVRRTLRGRLSVNYDFTDRWSWGASASQDVLGRDGGFQLGTQLRYRHPVTPDTYWETAVSANWGDRRYMQTRYGIEGGSSASLVHGTYALGGAWESTQLSWGMTTLLTRRWILFGNIGYTHLRNGAALSPLTGERDSVGATLGLAYRCCS